MKLPLGFTFHLHRNTVAYMITYPPPLFLNAVLHLIGTSSTDLTISRIDLDDRAMFSP